MTLLSELQVTWNQVQGLTRVGSQLWRTLDGSFKLLRRACSASPAAQTSKHPIQHPQDQNASLFTPKTNKDNKRQVLVRSMSSSMWDMTGTKPNYLYTKPHWWHDRVQWPFDLPAPQFLSEDSVSFMSFPRFLVRSDERLHVGHSRNKPNYPLHQTPVMAGPSTMTLLPSCTTVCRWRQYLSYLFLGF
jgi:hypothetical protein